MILLEFVFKSCKINRPFDLLMTIKSKKGSRNRYHNKLISTSGHTDPNWAQAVYRKKNLRKANFKNSHTRILLMDEYVDFCFPIFCGKEEANILISNFAKAASREDIRILKKQTWTIYRSPKLDAMLLGFLRGAGSIPSLQMTMISQPLAEETLKFALDFVCRLVGLPTRSGIHFAVIEFLFTYKNGGIQRVYPMLVHMLLALLPFHPKSYALSIVVHYLWNYVMASLPMRFEFRSSRNKMAADLLQHEDHSDYFWTTVISLPIIMIITGLHNWFGYFKWAKTLVGLYVVAWIGPLFEEKAKAFWRQAGIPFPGFVFGLIELIMYLRDGVALIYRIPAFVLHFLTDFMYFRPRVLYHRLFNLGAVLIKSLVGFYLYVIALSSWFMWHHYSVGFLRANLYNLERLYDAVFDEPIRAVWWASFREYPLINHFVVLFEEYCWHMDGGVIFLIEFGIKLCMTDDEFIWLRTSRMLGFMYGKFMIWFMFPIWISIPMNWFFHISWNFFHPHDQFNTLSTTQEATSKFVHVLNLVKTLYDRYVSKDWLGLAIWAMDVGMNQVYWAFDYFKSAIKLDPMTLLSDDKVISTEDIGYYFSLLKDSVFYQSLMKLFTSVLSVKFFGEEGIAREFVDNLKKNWFGNDFSWDAFVKLATELAGQLCEFAVTWDVRAFLRKPLMVELRMVSKYLRNNPYSTLNYVENQQALTSSSNVLGRLDNKRGNLTPEEMTLKKHIVDDMETRLNFITNEKTRKPAFPFMLMGPPGVGKTTIMKDLFNLCAKAAGTDFNPSAIVELQWQQTYPAEARPKGSAHALVYNDGPDNYKGFTEKGLLAFDVIAQTAIDSCSLVLPSASLEKKAELHNELKYLFFTSNHESFIFENNSHRMERRLNAGIVCRVQIEDSEGKPIPNSVFVHWSQEKQFSQTVFTFGSMKSDNKHLSFQPSLLKLRGADAMTYMAVRYREFVRRAEDRLKAEETLCRCGATMKRHYKEVEGEPVFEKWSDVCQEIPPEVEPRRHTYFNRVNEAVEKAMEHNPRLDSGYRKEEKNPIRFRGHDFTYLSDAEEKTETGNPEDKDYSDSPSYFPSPEYPAYETSLPALDNMTTEGKRFWERFTTKSNHDNMFRNEQERYESFQVFHNVAILFVNRWFWLLTFGLWAIAALIGEYYSHVPLYFHAFVVLFGISYQAKLCASVLLADEPAELLDRFAESGFIPDFMLQFATIVYMQTLANRLKATIKRNSVIIMSVLGVGAVVLAAYTYKNSKTVHKTRETSDGVTKSKPVGSLDGMTLLSEEDTQANTVVPVRENTVVDNMWSYENQPPVRFPKDMSKRQVWVRDIPMLRLQDKGTTLETMPNRVARNTYSARIWSYVGDEVVKKDRVTFTWLNQGLIVTVAHCLNINSDKFVVTIEELKIDSWELLPKDVRPYGELVFIRLHCPKVMNDLERNMVNFERPFHTTIFWKRRESGTKVRPSETQAGCLFESYETDISGTSGDCGSLGWCNTSAGVAVVGVFFARRSDKHIYFIPLRGTDVNMFRSMLLVSLSPSDYYLSKLINMGTLKLRDPPDNSLVATRESMYVEIVGTSTFSSTFSSSIIKSPVYDIFYPKLTEDYKPPYKTRSVNEGVFYSSWSHSTKNIDKGQPMHYHLRVEAYRAMYDQFLKDKEAQLRPLALAEAIFGCPEMDIERVPFNTSMGFTTTDGYFYRYRGIKNKFDLFTYDEREKKFRMDDRACEEINEMIEILKERPVMTYIELSHKDEVRPSAKVDTAKVRLFSVMDFNFNIVCRMFLLPLVKFCEANLPFMVSGLNAASPKWKKVSEKLKEYERIIEADGSGWDYSEDVEVFEALAVFMLLIAHHVGYPPEYFMVVVNCIRSVSVKIGSLNGDFFFINKMMPSGWVLTLFTNTLTNYNNHMCVWKLIFGIFESFFERMGIFVHGDDYIGGINGDIEECNTYLRKMIEIHAKFGFILTAGDKIGEPEFTTLENASFLKRGFKIHPDLGEVTAALNKDSIWKSLCFQSSKAGVTPEQRICDVAEMAQRELFLHSREALESFHDDIDSMDKMGLTVKKFSFEELKEAYFKEEMYMSGM